MRHESPSLVTLAENYMRGFAVSPQDVRAAIAPLFAQKQAEKMDCVVLGCTHFPLLLPFFLQQAPAINWIDSGQAIARRTAIILGHKGLCEQAQAKVKLGKIELCTTDHSQELNFDSKRLGALGLEQVVFV